MNCPACFNRLTPRHAGSITVDVCQEGCGGIWFDAFELAQVDEASDAAGHGLLEVRSDPRLTVDHSRKRSCPRCDNVKLMRHFYSARKRIQVDQCPNCAGYWLDAGELAKVRAERAEASAEAAGRNISMDVIRYLYRLRSESQDTALE
jgi:Zn-finger nucleic acid-binding protein